MLRLIITIINLALVSEAARVAPLFRIIQLKNKADELNSLKSKYGGLIKSQSVERTRENSMNYNSDYYFGTFNVGPPGQEFRILFDTASFRSIYSRGLCGTKLFAFALKRSVLLLGDIDSSYYSGEISYVPLTSDLYWQFQIDASMDGMSVSEKCEAIIDTGNSLIVIADSQYESVMHALGATFSTHNNSHSHTIDCSTVDSLPSLQLNIGHTLFTIEPKEYIIQYRGICSTVFEKLGTDVWILGGPFIRKYFAVFDLANKRLGFALPN